MSLTTTLRKLGDNVTFPHPGRAQRRWGQLLREPTSISAQLQELTESSSLAPLVDLADIGGGVVTRANAYFVVRELPFEGVPDRFRLTKRDHRRVAVVEDGLGTYHPIERICLRPIIKGPDSLVGPTTVRASDQRLFDCQDRSKDQLRKLRANGALKYLKRGESVAYKVSEDSLKGGIPAQRSNIKNRKPYWYSLHAPSSETARIVVPEHFDERFPATLLKKGDDAVVLDKLFTITPPGPKAAELLLAGLNSIVAWYQFEFRGRTQLGEGVLELKIADWNGLLLANPTELKAQVQKDVLDAFKPLRERETGDVGEELADKERIWFDLVYLDALGVSDPDALRTDLERELRAAMSERKERAASVADAKAARAVAKRVSANVDAYASRVAANMEPFPDPRAYVPKGTEEEMILILGPVEGTLTIGEDLLTQGDVYAGENRIAAAGDIQSAQFVHSVLLQDPEQTAVSVPTDGALADVMKSWEEACREWREQFDQIAKRTTSGLVDDRLRAQVRERALVLLHAK